MTINKACISFYSGPHTHINYRQTEVTKTKTKIFQNAIKLRNRTLIKSLYDNSVLLLSPVELRTFSQQMTTLQQHFIS